MRLWCIWCQQFLRAETLCTCLPAGTLWPVGAALCIVCCPHEVHGIPLAARPGAPQGAEAWPSSRIDVLP